MKVKFYPGVPKLCHGNIIWANRDRGSAYYRVSKFAPRNGRFPNDHPAAPGADVTSNDRAEFATSPSLQAFRARGYWASCFPEGDGITLSCGWEVECVDR